MRFSVIARRSSPMCRMLGMCSVAVFLAACGSDSGKVSGPENEAYWAIRANQRALSLAVTADSTAQLSATVYAIGGAVVPDAPAVQFSTQDSAVRVTPEGLVTARYTTPDVPARVIAAVTRGNQTLFDTILVHVDSFPPTQPLANFAVRTDGDSTQLGASANDFGGRTTLTVEATDENGVALPTGSVLTYFESSDPSIATINRTTGEVIATVPGHVRFYATTLAFGVAKRDSVDFTITYPTSGSIQTYEITPLGSTVPELRFGPPTVIVSVGAIVQFTNFSDKAINVLFDDPSAATATCGPFGCEFQPATGDGDIEPFKAVEGTFSFWQFRKFTRAGTYHFHSTLYDASGTVVVKSGL